jgi:hypothetical protein
VFQTLEATSKVHSGWIYTVFQHALREGGQEKVFFSGRIPAVAL